MSGKTFRMCCEVLDQMMMGHQMKPSTAARHRIAAPEWFRDAIAEGMRHDGSRLVKVGEDAKPLSYGGIPIVCVPWLADGEVLLLTSSGRKLARTLVARTQR